MAILQDTLKQPSIRNCFVTQSFWFAVKNWFAFSGPALSADEIFSMVP